MRVHSRRWFCDAPTCPRKIFAERFDGALARYARRTDGTTDLLTTFALQAGGEGGTVSLAVEPQRRVPSCRAHRRGRTRWRHAQAAAFFRVE
jgi:hypothetical protein